MCIYIYVYMMVVLSEFKIYVLKIKNITSCAFHLYVDKYFW